MPTKKKKAEEQVVSTPSVTTSKARKLNTSQKRVMDKMKTAGLIMPFEESLIAKPRVWLESDMLNANWLLGEGVPMGSLWELIGAESSSKAVPLSTPVLTPNGWKKMADINVGDEVCDPDGGVQVVEDVAYRGERQVYKITFSDDTIAYCDKEHLWKVKRLGVGVADSNKHKWSVLSFEEIAKSGIHHKLKKTGNARDNRYTVIRKWKLPRVHALTFSPRELSVDPYIVGMLLGIAGYEASTGTLYVRVHRRGRALIHSLHKALSLQYGSILEFRPIANELRDTIFAICRLDSKDATASKELVELAKLAGVDKPVAERSIPNDYLWGSTEQRTALLRGLLDTLGVAHKGHATFISKSKRLVEDVTYLARSLGALAKIKFLEEYKTSSLGVVYRDMWSVQIRADFQLFTTESKSSVYIPREEFRVERTIVDMERVEQAKEEMKCIRVSGKSGTYVINDFIVTHNSSFAYSLGGNLQANYGAIVVPYDTERLDNAMARRSELIPELTALPTKDARASIPNIMNDMMERLVILQEENDAGSYDSDDGPAKMIIIWDSIGATATQTLRQALANKRGTGGAAVQMGITVEPMSATAALLTSALKILHPAIVEANALAIFLNQMRVTMAAAGSWGGPSEHSGGGRALKHAANIRLKAVHENIYKQFNASGAKNLTEGETVTGIMFSLTTIKNKVSAPFKTTGFINMFGQGIDVVASNVLHALFDLQDMAVLPPVKLGRVATEDGKNRRITELFQFYKTHPVEYAELCERIKEAQRKMDALLTPDAFNLLQQQADEIDRAEDDAEYIEDTNNNESED